MCMSSRWRRVGGWYTAEQAASGANLYQAKCASCHGAKLEGGAGPSLKGTTWHQMYGGRKTLDGMGRNHWPDGQYAGTTYTTQQSLDIVSYLLQQNGAARGEPAACGHARIVGGIAGEIEAASDKWMDGHSVVSRQTKPSASHLCFRGVLRLLLAVKKSGMSRRATPIRLSAIP